MTSMQQAATQAWSRHAAQASPEEAKNLWVGDLQYWMDENYLWNSFGAAGDIQNVKIIRNKTTGYSEGYGFVEFGTHASALNVLQTYNGTTMPQTESQPFRLNWAQFGGGKERHQQADVTEFSIFVGDLDLQVTDYVLTDTFRSRYPSVRGAKVVLDNVSGRSKGYGFVRFGSEEERDRALSEMNGQYCMTRPMRISIATPKKPGGPGGPPFTAPGAGGAGGIGGVGAGGGGAGGGGPRHGGPPYNTPMGEEDPNNTTIFVGGLDPSVSDDQLRQVFSAYGDILYVKIPFGKGCGFVQFGSRAQAEEAIRGLHGSVVGHQTIRLSWGRHPASKRAASSGWGSQQSSDYSQGWGAQQQGGAAAAGGYYGATGGYGAAGYDQSAAAAAAGTGGYDASGGYGAGYGGYGASGGYGGYGGDASAAAPAWQTPAAAPAAAPAASTPAATPATPSQPSTSGAQSSSSVTFATGVNVNKLLTDPMQPPNIDEMNAQFMAKNQALFLGQHVWFTVDSLQA